MRPALPVHLAAHQAQKGLVNQRRGLQREARAARAQPLCRELAQVVVHQRHQPLEGLSVAVAPGAQEAGDFAAFGFGALHLSAGPEV